MRIGTQKKTYIFLKVYSGSKLVKQTTMLGQPPAAYSYTVNNFIENDVEIFHLANPNAAIGEIISINKSNPIFNPAGLKQGSPIFRNDSGKESICEAALINKRNHATRENRKLIL